MAHLLKLVKFDKVKPSIQPLAFEFQASNDATPFLVSTSRSLLWVNEAPSNVVRAAVRPKTKLQDFYTEVIEEIAEVGIECSWGNVQPFNKVGIRNAIEYVSSYEVGEVECLIHPDDKDRTKEMLSGSGIPYSICKWLPKGCLVVIPKDRSFLGIVGVMTTGFVSVIQNPSRGIAIVR